MVQRKNRAAVDLLVQWQDCSQEEAQWVPYEDFIKKFPHFDLETRSN
ncbi:uncharacterized protein M6B38_169585 [Iris pallida]|uniref:Chromo domain-containing protein n=1 Tax=Iris pallida TaxID=29817 RepID=A0AAX6EUU8_IRIPA|nr:uncharacterized protein M6B38_169585 [Iris pallida]